MKQGVEQGRGVRAASARERLELRRTLGSRRGAEQLLERGALTASERGAVERLLATGSGAARVRADDDAVAAVLAEVSAAFARSLGLSGSPVEIRADRDAAGRAAAQGARGLAQDNVVYLDPQRADPTTTSGREVLAHELIHTAQARRGGAPSPVLAAEAEAASLAPALAAGAATVRPTAVLAPTRLAADKGADRELQRQEQEIAQLIDKGGPEARSDALARAEELQALRGGWGQSSHEGNKKKEKRKAREAARRARRHALEGCLQQLEKLRTASREDGASGPGATTQLAALSERLETLRGPVEAGEQTANRSIEWELSAVASSLRRLGAGGDPKARAAMDQGYEEAKAAGTPERQLELLLAAKGAGDKDRARGVVAAARDLALALHARIAPLVAAQQGPAGLLRAAPRTLAQLQRRAYSLKGETRLRGYIAWRQRTATVIREAGAKRRLSHADVLSKLLELSKSDARTNVTADEAGSQEEADRQNALGAEAQLAGLDAEEAWNPEQAETLHADRQALLAQVAPANQRLAQATAAECAAEVRNTVLRLDLIEAQLDLLATVQKGLELRPQLEQLRALWAALPGQLGAASTPDEARAPATAYLLELEGLESRLAAYDGAVASYARGYAAARDLLKSHPIEILPAFDALVSGDDPFAAAGAWAALRRHLLAVGDRIDQLLTAAAGSEGKLAHHDALSGFAHRLRLLGAEAGGMRSVGQLAWYRDYLDTGPGMELRSLAKRHLGDQKSAGRVFKPRPLFVGIEGHLVFVPADREHDRTPAPERTVEWYVFRVPGPGVSAACAATRAAAQTLPAGAQAAVVSGERETKGQADDVVLEVELDQKGWYVARALSTVEGSAPSLAASAPFQVEELDEVHRGAADAYSGMEYDPSTSRSAVEVAGVSPLQSATLSGQIQGASLEGATVREGVGPEVSKGEISQQLMADIATYQAQARDLEAEVVSWGGQWNQMDTWNPKLVNQHHAIFAMVDELVQRLSEIHGLPKTDYNLAQHLLMGLRAPLTQKETAPTREAFNVSGTYTGQAAEGQGKNLSASAIGGYWEEVDGATTVWLSDRSGIYDPSMVEHSATGQDFRAAFVQAAAVMAVKFPLGKLTLQGLLPLKQRKGKNNTVQVAGLECQRNPDLEAAVSLGFNVLKTLVGMVFPASWALTCSLMVVEAAELGGQIARDLGDGKKVNLGRVAVEIAQIASGAILKKLSPSGDPTIPHELRLARRFKVIGAAADGAELVVDSVFLSEDMRQGISSSFQAHAAGIHAVMKKLEKHADDPNGAEARELHVQLERLKLAARRDSGVPSSMVLSAGMAVATRVQGHVSDGGLPGGAANGGGGSSGEADAGARVRAPGGEAPAPTGRRDPSRDRGAHEPGAAPADEVGGLHGDAAAPTQRARTQADDPAAPRVKDPDDAAGAEPARHSADTASSARTKSAAPPETAATGTAAHDTRAPRTRGQKESGAESGRKTGAETKKTGRGSSKKKGGKKKERKRVTDAALLEIVGGGVGLPAGRAALSRRLRDAGYEPRFLSMRTGKPHPIGFQWGYKKAGNPPLHVDGHGVVRLGRAPKPTRSKKKRPVKRFDDFGGETDLQVIREQAWQLMNEGDLSSYHQKIVVERQLLTHDEWLARMGDPRNRNYSTVRSWMKEGLADRITSFTFNLGPDGKSLGPINGQDAYERHLSLIRGLGSGDKGAIGERFSLAVRSLFSVMGPKHIVSSQEVISQEKANALGVDAKGDIRRDITTGAGEKTDGRSDARHTEVKAGALDSGAASKLDRDIRANHKLGEPTTLEMQDPKHTKQDIGRIFELLAKHADKGFQVLIMREKSAGGGARMLKGNEDPKSIMNWLNGS